MLTAKLSSKSHLFIEVRTGISGLDKTSQLSKHQPNFYFSQKTSVDISCESSVKQQIHMKCQDLFSMKKKKKKKNRYLKVLSAAVVNDVFMVNT